MKTHYHGTAIITRFSFLALVLIPLLIAGCGGNTPGSSAHPIATPGAAPLFYNLDGKGTIESVRANGTTGWVYANSTDLQGTGKFVVSGSTMYAAGYAVLALSTTTGKLLWRQSLPDSAMDLVAGDGNIYVVTNTRVLALNAHNGTLLWQQNVPANPFGFGPKNNLFLTPTLLVAAADGNILAYSATTGQQQWQNTDLSQNMGNIQTFWLVNDIIVAQGSPINDSTQGVIQAMKANSGQTLWQQTYVDSTTSIIQGITYMASTTAPGPNVPTVIQAIHVSDNKQLWQINTPIDNGQSSPTFQVTQNAIYWANSTSLTAWNLQGKQLWSTQVIDQISTMTAQGDQLFAATNQGDILSFNNQTGKQQWSDQISANLFQIRGNNLLVTNTESSADTITDLNPMTGAKQWSIQGAGAVQQLTLA